MADRTTTIVASLLFSFLSFAVPAAAAPPAGGAGPEQEACADRASGDACALPNNQLGTCASATCNRLDYSGGSPPKAIEEPCVICKAVAAQNHDGPPILGGDGGAEPPASSGAEPATDVEPAADVETKEPPKSSSRCQVDGSTPSPAGLALVAGLMLLGWRRRPASK